VLSITGLSLARFYGSLRQWDFLKEALSFSPLYPALSGFFWTLIGLLLAWGLWRGASWAPKLAIMAVAGYMVFDWFDRLVMASPAARESWPFILGLNLVVLVYTFWSLSRPVSRAFFGEAYDNRPQNI
jgi:uncharacterized membrane protein (DUF2068 family)